MTEILKRAGGKAVEANGKKVAGHRLIARLIWDLLTTGHTEFPDKTELRLAPKDWLELVRWVYSQIDGPPPTKLEHMGADGGEFTIRIISGINLDEDV